MQGRKGALAVGVEARRRVRRDHVSKYTAVFRRLVGHRWHCRHQGDAQAGRPERWCHRFPPVRSGRVARPIASSYSGNTKMPIVLGPKTVFGGSSVATDPSPELSSAVPATLHASLMARLDRLGSTAKEVLQTGAVIGRDFSYELLAAIGQWTDWELRRALGRLVAAGLVFQREMPPRSSFLFKHALVQDIAYSMLLLGLRRSLHGRIARTLEEQFADVTQARPETLAHHFTEAGLFQQAV